MKMKLKLTDILKLLNDEETGEHTRMLDQQLNNILGTDMQEEEPKNTVGC